MHAADAVGHQPHGNELRRLGRLLAFAELRSDVPFRPCALIAHRALPHAAEVVLHAFVGAFHGGHYAPDDAAWPRTDSSPV